MKMRFACVPLLGCILAACATDIETPIPALPPSPEQIAHAPVQAAIELAFPSAEWDFDRSLLELADDNVALRFVTLREMNRLALVSAQQAHARRDGNLGALLPLTWPAFPAQGLANQLPAPKDVILHYQLIPDGMQRDFILDNILPLTPKAHERFAPRDKVGVMLAQYRLGKLVKAGLIREEEARAEIQALNQLARSLPERAQPLSAKDKANGQKGKGPKADRTNSTGPAASGQNPTIRLRGGVTGELVVVPSPREMNVEPLADNATGPAAIHLMNMGRPDQGERAIASLRERFPELTGNEYKVVRADLGDLGVTHRLFVGPMEPDKARNLCQSLKAKGQNCTPTAF